MKVIPAIDLMNGQVVRLYKGDPNQKTIYSDDPISIAKQWEDAGADLIHLVYLDATLGLGTTFELIKNNELKKLLLEMFNHQKDRNYATSTEIDQWNISKRGQILKNFRVRFSYNSYDGEFYGSRTVNTFDFNRDYYMSNDFYGLLSQAQYYSNMYLRLLSDIKKSYETAKSLSVEELKKS